MSDNFNFKAFEEGGADQLLRQSVEGMRVEPNPGLWKNISRKLLWKELIHFNFTNLSPKLWMAGTAGLIIIATATYFILNGKSNDDVVNAPGKNATPPAFSAKNTLSAASTGRPARQKDTGEDSKINVQQSNKSVNDVPLIAKHIEVAHVPSSSTHAIQTKSRKIFSEGTSNFNEETPPSEPASIMEQGLTETYGITRISPFCAIVVFNMPGADTIITISNAFGIIKFRKSEPVEQKFFSASLGVSPEVAFYSEPETYSKTNYWLNGGITYHISRFTIGTGFGLGFVYDEGKYRAEFKSRDSVGYFTAVTSFSVGNDNEIIYQTQAVTVYDSLQHASDFRTKNRYSYLQVPLLFGYDFFETNRISLTFQAGPAVSVLLGSRKSDPVIEYQNARIIRVDEGTPSRVQTNWQLWANLYLEMRMNKQVSIYIEPSFKYYLKPMVTRENVTYKAPWTIGLGIGLQFNFGQKMTKR